MGTTLDQMNLGTPVEDLVWAQSAHYFLRTYRTTLWPENNIPRGGAGKLQRWMNKNPD